MRPFARHSAIGALYKKWCKAWLSAGTIAAKKMLRKFAHYQNKHLAFQNHEPFNGWEEVKDDNTLFATFVAYRHFSKSLQGILKYYSIRPHMHTHGRVVRFSTQQYLHFILIFSQKVIARKSLRVFFLNSIVLKRRKKFKHFATILFDHLPF